MIGLCGVTAGPGPTILLEVSRGACSHRKLLFAGAELLGRCVYLNVGIGNLGIQTRGS